MKTRILSAFHQITNDRQILAVCFVILLLSLAYIVYVALSIQPTELQVATHYSAFGETHFYRDQWYSIIGLAVFGVIVPVLHIAIVGRLLREGLRPFALGLGYVTIVLLLLAFVYAKSIIAVAFLS